MKLKVIDTETGKGVTCARCRRSLRNGQPLFCELLVRASIQGCAWHEKGRKK